MANIERPPLNLLDSQGTTVAVKGKNVGGENLPEDQFSWDIQPAGVADLATSRVDPVTGETIQAPPYSRFVVNTHPGAAVITAAHAASDRTETMPLNVAFSEPGELGLSAGEPFADQ